MSVLNTSLSAGAYRTMWCGTEQVLMHASIHTHTHVHTHTHTHSTHTHALQCLCTQTAILMFILQQIKANSSTQMHSLRVTFSTLALRSSSPTDLCTVCQQSHMHIQDVRDRKRNHSSGGVRWMELLCGPKTTISDGPDCVFH